uniref:Golgi SNAP receptor complex member 2 n=1 Tax=Cacopsylla melanoneura TaxID=428564 RepID=A0A8D8YDT4_9HEMI
MEALYHQTNRMVLETQEYFHNLDRIVGDDSEQINKEIQDRLNSISKNCEKLSIMLFKEPLAKRHNTKLKLDQLKYDLQHLQAGFRSYQFAKQRKKQDELEREQLLSRRFTATDSDNTTILIDHNLQHQQSLINVNNRTDELLNAGMSMLNNIREQGMSMKSTQMRIRNIANTLGLSNTTMRLIEKRVQQDKYILLGGMAVTMVIIVVVIVYF